MTAICMAPVHASRQAVRGGSPMLVATRTFSARYDGEIGHVTAGERFAPDHELVKRHPDAFAAAATRAARHTPRATTTLDPRDVRARKPASATAHPRAGRMLPRIAGALGPRPPLPELIMSRQPEHDPQLLDTGSPITVTVSDHVHDEIEAGLRAVPAGYETGGLLLGQCHRDGYIRVHTAWGPGPDAEHYEGALHVDYDAHLEQARQLAYDTGRGSQAVGFWHNHPRGLARPSPGDLAVFGELLDRAGVSRFVGLIVANPERDRRYRPAPTIWVTRRTGRDQLVCERAR